METNELAIAKSNVMWPKSDQYISELAFDDKIQSEYFRFNNNDSYNLMVYYQNIGIV